MTTFQIQFITLLTLSVVLEAFTVIGQQVVTKILKFVLGASRILKSVAWV